MQLGGIGGTAARMGLMNARRSSAVSSSFWGLLLATTLGTVCLTGGCSTGPRQIGPAANEGGAASCTDGGGPVPGDADAHCTDADGNPIIQETLADACMDSTPSDAEGTGGAAPEGEEEEQLVLFNTEGDDDDCKYHVAFSASCVERNRDVTLTFHANNRSDDSAVEGAAVTTEIYLSDTHLAPNTKPKTVVVEPGVYKIGPVRFDKPGRWTVRFHLFEECLDAREDSPHGHIAFFVDVP
jgi:YtkA-like